MDFEFNFPIVITGKTVGEPRTVAHIDGCIALVEQDEYDPDEWTIYDVLIDGTMVPHGHYLRNPMLRYLTSEEMWRKIDRAWRIRLSEDLLEEV